MLKRSVCMLVFSLLKIEESTPFLEFWIEAISAKTKSPIVLVGTQLEKTKDKDAPKRLQQKWEEKYSHISIKVMGVNLEKGEGIDLVKAHVQNAVIRETTMGETLPTTVLALEKKIIKEAESTVPPVIDRQKLVTLCHSCNITDEREIQRAARALSDLGSIVTFDNDPNLFDTFVISPKWLTEFLAYTLEYSSRYVKTGQLEHKDLSALYRGSSFQGFARLFHKLLLILENFELVFPLEPFGGSPETKFTGKSLIPFLLPPKKPDNFNKLFPDNLRSEQRQVGRRYEFEHIPYGFFGKLTIAVLHYCQLRSIWGGGLILLREIDDHNEEILITVEGNVLTLTFRSTNRIPTVRHVIECVDTILREYKLEDNYRIFIPCSHCKEENAEPYLFTLDECESMAISGKLYINCQRDNSLTPVGLDQLVPDLTMKDVEESKINFSELLQLQLIGSGGAATVYKAQWEGQDVAMKVIRVGEGETPTDFERQQFSKVFNEFRREAAVMSGLEHPNLVSLKGVCLEPLCILTEYLENGDLYNYLHTKNVFGWPLILKAALDIAQGMQFLHSAQPPIIHRDLKSPNILLNSVTAEQQIIAKVADFGLSGSVRSVSNVEVANPSWLAPEILRKEEFTTRCDVYSYGVILWEMLSRDTFFAEFQHLSQIEEAVKNAKRPKIPPCPSPYKRLIKDCWHQEPRKRPTFKEIKERLLREQENILREINYDDLLPSFHHDHPPKGPPYRLLNSHDYKNPKTILLSPSSEIPKKRAPPISSGINLTPIQTTDSLRDLTVDSKSKTESSSEAILTPRFDDDTSSGFFAKQEIV